MIKMKTMSTLVLAMFIVIFSTTNAIGQSSPFTGEWKLNRTKTVLQSNRLFLSQIKISLKSDSLLTTRVYQSDSGEEYPFVENLSLDGKECKIIIYDMPRTSKALFSAKAGLINVESTTTFYGDNGEDNLKVKETWKVEEKGNMLNFMTSGTSSAGSSSDTLYFDRVK
jgi:hypothetical protein